MTNLEDRPHVQRIGGRWLYDGDACWFSKHISLIGPNFWGATFSKIGAWMFFRGGMALCPSSGVGLADYFYELRCYQISNVLPKLYLHTRIAFESCYRQRFTSINRKPRMSGQNASGKVPGGDISLSHSLKPPSGAVFPHQWNYMEI